MMQWASWVYSHILCMNLHLYIMHVVATGFNGGEENYHEWVINDDGNVYEFHSV